MTILLLAFVSALLYSFVLTKFVRGIATRRRWASAPASDHHLHRQSVPRLGGVAIALSFLIAIATSLVAGQLLVHAHQTASLRPLRTILPPAVLILLLGIYDDFRPVTAYFKFFVQVIAGAMLFAGGLRILDLPALFGGHQFSWYISLPLTILWVVAITNAFNLIDGLDGLAAGSALFSTLVLFVVALVDHMPVIALIASGLGGAALGFLQFNFNPATIFLGDCGSLFLGFMLSALALYGTQKSATITAAAVPLVCFGLPLLEISLSVTRRWISGKPIFEADLDHIHHKLLRRGFSQRQAVILLYGVSAVFALLSLFLLWPAGSHLGLVLGVLGAGIWIGVQRLGYPEFAELRRMAQRTIDQRQIFANNLAIRGAIESLKKAADFPSLTVALNAAFANNDFDAFELRAELPVRRDGISVVQPTVCPHICWKKPGALAAAEFGNMWSLNLQLLSTDHHYCGRFLLFRAYANRGLRLDIDLLTSSFASVLADALQRIAEAHDNFLLATDTPVLLEARAG